MTAARAAGWSSLIIGLILATVAATTIGTWQTIKPRGPDIPPDTAASRQTVLDTVNSAVPKLLSYTPDNVDTTLNAAKSLLTGEFQKSYSDLIDRTVIPGAKEKNVTAMAKVAAAAVESLTPDKASMLVFVNQTVTPGSAAPTNTASTIRVGLQRVNDAWLIDALDPI